MKLTLTCSKSKRRAVEQDVKSVQISKYEKKKTKKDYFVVLVSLLLTLNIFCALSQFFYFNPEQVNTSWHLLDSWSHIQKLSPRCVFQVRFSKNIQLVYSGTFMHGIQRVKTILDEELFSKRNYSNKKCKLGNYLHCMNFFCTCVGSCCACVGSR